MRFYVLAFGDGNLPGRFFSFATHSGSFNVREENHRRLLSFSLMCYFPSSSLDFVNLKGGFFSYRFLMAKKQSLIFLSAIPSLYRWADSEVLGIPSKVTPKFLKSLREEYLLTQEGEYEEEYYLEAPSTDERVCYINLHDGPRWIWIYDVLISKFGVRFPFTHFQFSILECTGAAPSQLHPNSWAMIRSFEVICDYLNVPPSSNVFFYLFTLTRPSGVA